MKKFFKWLVFLFTGKGEIGESAVGKNLADYSGQGRNTYGR